MPPRRVATPSPLRQAALLLVGSLLSGLPATLRAQGAAGGLGTVRGVVYDSLARAPLAGARVWSADGARATTTDARGRFTLDSVATDGRPIGILAEHPAADSVGLTTLAAAVAVPPGGSAQVTVAVPSYATLRAAACQGIPEAGHRDGGVLLGTVRNAATGNPVAGAVVRIAWLHFRGRGARGEASLADVVEESLDAATDGAGSFYACGLPTTTDVTMQASAVLPTAAGADSARSGEVTTALGERRIRRRDLVVGGRAVGVVVARVLGPDEQPLAGAQVYADNDQPAQVGADGQAVLRGVPTGTRAVAARRIGFTPGDAIIDVAEQDTARVTLRLTAVPQELQAVRVQGVRRLVEVEERRQTGFGHVITGEQLARSPMLTSIFMQVPSLQVQGSGVRLQVLARKYGLTGGAWCPLSVYIDGRRSDMDELQLFAPKDLLAVEVYPRGAHAPQQYVRPDDMGACGVILAWIKR